MLSPLRVANTLATKNALERLASYLEPSPAFRRVWRQFLRRGKRFERVPFSLVHSSILPPQQCRDDRFAMV
jgi:hypothetical protein